MEHILKSDEIIAVTNGSHVTVKRLYLFAALLGAVLLIVSSYIIPPFVWKANIENEIKDLHKADTTIIQKVNTFIDNQNTSLDNQNILLDNLNVIMDNQVEIRTNVADLKNKLHSGWITPIPDNYQRMQRLKQNKLK